MTVKLSEEPSLYQPTGPVEQLQADLEMFSDPAQYDQDDPMLIFRKELIEMILSGDISEP